MRPNATLYKSIICTTLWIFVSSLSATWAGAEEGAEEEDAPPPEVPAPQVPKQAAKLEIPKPENPFKIPEGPSKAGWELYVKNDIAGAEAAFQQVIKEHPHDLKVLEGLRTCLVYNGRSQEIQQINMRMIEASVQSPLCAAFAMRAIEGQAFSESRAQLKTCLAKVVPLADDRNKGMLQDLLATLHLDADDTEKAKETLKGLGYVDRWLFVTGPFGFYDLNNRMARRFAPEKPLKKLEFEDDRGKPIMVRKDLPVPFRDLSLETLFPGARGVFYALTNLHSETDQEVLIIGGTPSEARIYLRGYPILEAQLESQYPREPQIVRTKLIKGNNPLLVKLPYAGRLTLRVLTPAYASPVGVSVKPLSDAELALHEVKPIRGFRFSQPSPGVLSSHFLNAEALKGLKDQDLSLDEKFLLVAYSGNLDLAEALWLELAAQQENALACREVIARTAVGSFPDSVGLLDTGARILASVGNHAGHSGSRHDEEARSMRERGLELDKGSHQHLLGLYYFFQQRELKDQAFNLIKTCAQLHPKSAKAQEQLGQAYLERNRTVLARDQFEKATKLDNAYLSQLVRFHEVRGDRARARELRAKLESLGLLGRGERLQRMVAEGKIDEAQLLLAEQEKAYPNRKDDMIDLRARLLLEKGDLEGAFAMREQLVKLQPQSQPALLAAVDLAIRLKRDEKAKEMLRSFLRAHPGNFELRRRLRELEGKTDNRWWEPYDIQVADIDTSKFSQENYPRSTYAWIVDFMVTKIYPDLSRESYVHIAQKVLNQTGINELSEVLLQAQREDLVFIRTLNPDGSSYQPENVLNFNLAQSASLYKVGPGSILEHAYVEHRDADEIEPTFSMGFNFNALEAPRAVSRWIVMIPPKVDLDIRKIRPEMVEEKILPGTDGYTVYEWTNKQVEGIKQERFMPPEDDEEVIPLITVETDPRPWRSSGWLLERDNLFLPHAAREVARKLSDRFQEEQVRFSAIVEWVRQNIQPGKSAQTMDDVWTLRSGNTAQMTDLAAALCKEAGLSVRRGLVNMNYLPGRIWRTRNQRRRWEPSVLTAFGSGGRMLVLEPKTGPDVWMQYTGQPSEYFSIHSLYDGQAGALALCPSDDGVQIKRVRGEELGQISSRHRVVVELDARGGGSMQGRIKIFGLLGGQLRRVLNDPKQAEEIPKTLLRNFWPRLESSEVTTKNLKAIESPLELIYFGRIDNLAESAENSFFLQPFPNPANLLTLIGPGKRTHDLVIKSELTELEMAFTYMAPVGHCWSQVPDDLFICTEFGFYIADFNVKGRKLTCTRNFLLPEQRISPEKYAALQTFLEQIAKTEQQRVAYTRLEPSLADWTQAILSQGYASHGSEAEAAAPAEVEP